MAKRKTPKVPAETFGHTIYVLPIPFAEVEALHAEDKRFHEWFTPVEGLGVYSALLSNSRNGDFDDPDVAWATAFSARCEGPVFLGYFHDDFPHVAMFEGGAERYDGWMRDPEEIVREAGLGVIFGERAPRTRAVRPKPSTFRLAPPAMEWLTRVDDRVSVLAPAARQVIASPDGKLLALRSLDAPGSLLTGEHVHVIERATGREVVAVFGREYLLTFAWASDALLILRDHSGHAGWLQRAIVPDGGIESERMVSALTEWDVAIDLSVDRRRAVVRPEIGVAARESFSSSEGEVPTHTTAVVDLPSMDEVLSTDPERLPDKLESTAARLSPEGRWLFTRQERHLAVWSVDAPQDPPRVYELAEGEDFAGVVWTSDRRVLVSFSVAGSADVRRIDALDVIDQRWTTLATAARGAALPSDLRLDPDARYVAGIARGERASLVVLDIADGRVLSRRDLPGSLCAAIWTADGRALVTASAEGDAVVVHRWSPAGGDAEVVASIAGRGVVRALRLSHVGDSAVLVEDPTRYRDGFGAAVVSLAS